MKSDTTDGAVQEEIGDITQRQLEVAWHDGKTIREIASDTGLAIGEVNRRLKPILKAIVKDGVEYYGEKNDS